MNAPISLGDIIQRGTSIARTNFGQQIIGNLAQPVFVNLREQETERLKQDLDEEQVTKPATNIFTTIATAFKNKFAWGDLITIFGVAFMAVQSRLFPTKSEKPGFFEGLFRTAALGMTFGGSISAMVGRAFEWDQKVALGDDLIDLHVLRAEKHGKKIFTIYDEATKEKLKTEALNLDKILVYPPGVRESILERHEKDDIGGLLDGKPGTGKTDGVKCILGKWANRIESQGYEAVIAELNLANFDEYLKDVNRNQSDMMEFIQAGSNLSNSAGNSSGSLLQNQGILVLELLIRRIQKLKIKVDKHNQAHPERQQKLAVFVDEFDKIFDPRTLQGCDKARLKNLLLQFNELFIQQEILLTSNRTLEEMLRELKRHLESGDGASATEVWAPMYDRLAAKNKVSIPYPGPNEQAEIMAGRILERYPQFINWQDFGISKPNTGSIELDRKVLAKALEAITNEINAALNGRQIHYASEDLISMLVGRARELRAASGIPDVAWDKMTATEKIARTGAQIDREMIKATLLNKSSNMRLNYGDINSDLAKNLINNYLKLDSIKTKFPDSKIPQISNISELHGLLSTAYKPMTLGARQVYMSQEPVQVGGEEYRHFIYQHSNSELHSMNSKAEFSIGYLNTKDPQKKFNTQKLNADEMIQSIAPAPDTKATSLTKMFSSIGDEFVKKLAEAKIDPALIGSIINHIGKASKATAS